jgi:hypothetical protein
MAGVFGIVSTPVLWLLVIILTDLLFILILVVMIIVLYGCETWSLTLSK